MWALALGRRWALVTTGGEVAMAARWGRHGAAAATGGIRARHFSPFLGWKEGRKMLKSILG